MSSGRRLLLRLNTRCNSGCAHCTIADIAHLPEKETAQAKADMLEARRAQCTELVIMRGEATLRRDLLRLVKFARKVGFTHVQLQTNARILSARANAARLVAAGLNFFEVSFFGHNAAHHDAIDGNAGAFVQACQGIAHLVELGAGVLVTVPVVRANYLHLKDITETLHGLGVTRVQFNFSRPVQIGPQWQTECLVRLSDAAPLLREAMWRGRELGLTCETEAVPLCHLDPAFWSGGDIDADFEAHRVEDIHRSETSRGEVQRLARPWASQCTACPVKERCPTTWAAYQALFGTWEFLPPTI